METTVLPVGSTSLVNALERVFPRYGYRTLRSFDLELNGDAQAASCPCGCGYAVLLVFAQKSHMALEGTITVRGASEWSYITLSPIDADSELTARFPTILVEVLQQRPGGDCSPVARGCV